MQILIRRTFDKQYQQLPKRIQKHFNARVQLLLEEPQHPLLNVHALKGELTGFMSINVTGDYRAIFAQHDDCYVFYKIGTHSQLYS